MNGPLVYIDPFGLDILNANNVKPQDWHNFDTNNDVMALSEVTVTASKSSSTGDAHTIVNGGDCCWERLLRRFLQQPLFWEVYQLMALQKMSLIKVIRIDAHMGRNSDMWKDDK